MTNPSAGCLRGILMDVRTLIREEIELARVEIREQAGRARAAAVSFAIAAVSLACGGILLLVALATGIADLLDWPIWSGFLIVAMLLSLVGMVTLVVGAETAAEGACRPGRNRLDVEGELGMDSEAAVIKSEMRQTRANLDRKIAALETRARDLTPRRYALRHLPDHALDRAIGGVSDAGRPSHGLETCSGTGRDAASRFAPRWQLTEPGRFNSRLPASFRLLQLPRRFPGVGQAADIGGWELTMIYA